jgi:hypothetical protein
MRKLPMLTHRGSVCFARSKQEVAVRARRFLLNWVSKNVPADSFRMGRSEAHCLARRLLDFAAKRGISKAELETAAEEHCPASYT